MRPSTYEALIRKHVQDGNVCTLLSGVSDGSLPYGRIRRDAEGEFFSIIEERDCTPEEKAIRELNAGVYVFEAPALFSVLSKLRADNAQGEYYLTDVPGLIRKTGGKVGVSCACTPHEMLGVNTPQQLHEVEAALTGAC
jgi:bifunctional UDP-N-acetylglucosamine pyrophosphorylase/glucosamine-1-phosphate N-acetyltransferase/UDP-N-acetylglucosamine pyrophosphorylase